MNLLKRLCLLTLLFSVLGCSNDEPKADIEAFVESQNMKQRNDGNYDIQIRVEATETKGNCDAIGLEIVSVWKTETGNTFTFRFDMGDVNAGEEKVLLFDHIIDGFPEGEPKVTCKVKEHRCDQSNAFF